MPRTRQKIIPFDERLGERIRAGMIVDRLQKHIDGTLEMTNTQVQAARILLNKVMPDVKAYEIKHVEQDSGHAIDNTKLRAIINGESKRLD